MWMKMRRRLFCRLDRNAWIVSPYLMNDTQLPTFPYFILQTQTSRWNIAPTVQSTHNIPQKARFPPPLQDDLHLSPSSSTSTSPIITLDPPHLIVSLHHIPQSHNIHKRRPHYGNPGKACKTVCHLPYTQAEKGTCWMD